MGIRNVNELAEALIYFHIQLNYEDVTHVYKHFQLGGGMFDWKSFQKQMFPAHSSNYKEQLDELKRAEVREVMREYRRSASQPATAREYYHYDPSPVVNPEQLEWAEEWDGDVAKGDSRQLHRGKHPLHKVRRSPAQPFQNSLAKHGKPGADGRTQKRVPLPPPPKEHNYMVTPKFYQQNHHRTRNSKGDNPFLKEHPKKKDMFLDYQRRF